MGHLPKYLARLWLLRVHVIQLGTLDAKFGLLGASFNKIGTQLHIRYAVQETTICLQTSLTVGMVIILIIKLQCVKSMHSQSKTLNLVNSIIINLSDYKMKD